MFNDKRETLSKKIKTHVYIFNTNKTRHKKII